MGTKNLNCFKMESHQVFAIPVAELKVNSISMQEVSDNLLWVSSGHLHGSRRTFTTCECFIGFWGFGVFLPSSEAVVLDFFGWQARWTVHRPSRGWMWLMVLIWHGVIAAGPHLAMQRGAESILASTWPHWEEGRGMAQPSSMGWEGRKLDLVLWGRKEV